MSTADHNTTEEVWKPVVGYEGEYEVSNLGRIKSKARTIIHGHTGTRIIPETIRKIQTRSHGRKYVLLSNKRPIAIHRAVAEAFIGPCPDGCNCNHIDGDPANNRVENLEWITHSENMKHAYRNGLTPVGEKRGNSKLTNSTAASIKKMLRDGVRVFEVAKHFCLHKSTVQNIKNGSCWAHIKLD